MFLKTPNYIFSNSDLENNFFQNLLYDWSLVDPKEHFKAKKMEIYFLSQLFFNVLSFRCHKDHFNTRMKEFSLVLAVLLKKTLSLCNQTMPNDQFLYKFHWFALHTLDWSVCAHAEH
jgi:hypothetical protein